MIPCGGLATRLGPHAARTPKFLVPVAGVPLAERVLPRLAQGGFDEVVLCVGHLGEAVRAFVGDGRRFGLRARYADEGAAPRGTWGAVRGAAPWLAPSFVVTYGDGLLSLELQVLLHALDARPWADGVMAVWRNRDAVEPSNVRFDAGHVRSYGRDGARPPPDAIDYGATALRRDAVMTLAEGAAAGLGALFTALAADGRLAAHEVDARFHEIGTPQGLADAEAAVRAGAYGGETR